MFIGVYHSLLSLHCLKECNLCNALHQQIYARDEVNPNHIFKSKLKMAEHTSRKSFDENLSEAVRKYRVLFHKSDPGFKDRHRRKNAWKNMAEELKVEGDGMYRPFFMFYLTLILPIYSQFHIFCKCIK